jgi:hypothetical protein
MENPLYNLKLSEVEVDILYTALSVLPFDLVYDHANDFSQDIKTVMTTLFEIGVRLDDTRPLKKGETLRA